MVLTSQRDVTRPGNELRLLLRLLAVSGHLSKTALRRYLQICYSSVFGLMGKLLTLHLRLFEPDCELSWVGCFEREKKWNSLLSSVLANIDYS